jgi:putative membrane protein
MFELVQGKFVVAAIVYSGLGIIVFALAFALIDLVTPKVSVWRELVGKQNLAMGVFLGALGIGMAMIIASAIHG